jgi:hypothetical protein
VGLLGDSTTQATEAMLKGAAIPFEHNALLVNRR